MAPPLTVTTPFGEDVDIVSLKGTEAISQTFSFDLDLKSQKDDLDFASVVGQGVTVAMELVGGSMRYIHGLAVDFCHAGQGDGYIVYRARLRPWLWMLTLASHCRIFQNQTVPDIVKAVFDAAGYSDYKIDVTGSYTAREYCVQLNESDFHFVSRLMEEEGIFYYFTHEDGKHTLVLADANGAFTDCPGHATAGFLQRDQARDHYGKVSRCTYRESVVTGSYQLNDYNFEKPTDQLNATAEGQGSEMGRYDYPGYYTEKTAGEALAKIRLQACESPGKILDGGSFAPGFTPGYKFTLENHPRTALNQAYVLAKVSHSADQDDYSNAFVAFPDTVSYRPPKLTPKYRVAGTQTAVVVGKSGEEIWTDKYGRIKVQFPWDLDGKKDENSSCWIRVIQSWAGKKWGTWFLPRIGQEVIVGFLEGDPDRPIVTGAVYNADMEVPYALPTNQTQSTLKSISSKSGEAGNEIRFEDKKDSEEFYVHAQKDMKVEVENDRSTTIIKGNETFEVSEGNREMTIAKGNETLTVSEGDRTISVAKGNETHDVKSKRDLTVTGNETHTNKADLTWDVKGNYSIKVSGDLSIDVDGSVTIKAGSDITVKAGGNLIDEAGSALTNKAGTDLTNQAGTGLTNKAGTELTNQAGTNLTNKAGVNLENNAGAMLTSKGSASGTVDGGGMLTLKGGIVQIN